MTAFLLYIIKSTCCLILFYLGYKALLSNETFYRFNRCVLLVGMLVCLSLPLVRIQTAGYGPLQQPLLQLEVAIAEEMGEERPSLSADIRHPAEVMPTVGTDSSVGWGTVFLYLYGGGIATGCGLLLVSSVSLFLLIRSGRKVMRDGYCLVLLGRDLVPFNWGNYILLSERDYREHPEEILTHEQVHCRKRHTLDLVFAEAVLLLHWFNPAAWLLKKELQEVHEFQADSGVLQSGIDATRYQLLLVKKAVSASSYTFANSFNHSKIKKRITMMLKDKSNSWARLKLLLLVPVAASALVAFARPDMNRKLELFVQNEGTTISPADQPYTREFFDKEIERYMGQAGKTGLDWEEKFEYLCKHANKVDFFILEGDEISYDNFFRTMEEIPARLKASLQKNSSTDKPLLIFFLEDASTSKYLIQKVFEEVGKAFAEYRATNVGKDAPILFFCGRTVATGQKNAASKKPANTVVLKFISEDKQTWVAYINPEDGREAIRSKLIDLKANNISTVSVSAPSDTPMGRIKDIKTALQDVYGMLNRRIEYQ